MITVFKIHRNRKENKGLDRNLIICHVICDISSLILHENNVYGWCYYSQFPGKPGGTRWLREFPQFSESRPGSANQQCVTWVQILDPYGALIFQPSSKHLYEPVSSFSMVLGRDFNCANERDNILDNAMSFNRVQDTN